MSKAKFKIWFGFVCKERDRCIKGEITIEEFKYNIHLIVTYEDNNLVFSTKQGRPLDPRNMKRTLKTIADNANIKKVNVHDLRHTFATRGLENGIELVVMKELVGHSSIKMTADLYTHVLTDKKKEAISKLNDTMIF